MGSADRIATSGLRDDLILQVELEAGATGRQVPRSALGPGAVALRLGSASTSGPAPRTGSRAWTTSSMGALAARHIFHVFEGGFGDLLCRAGLRNFKVPGILDAKYGCNPYTVEARSGPHPTLWVCVLREVVGLAGRKHCPRCQRDLHLRAEGLWLRCCT